MSPKKLPGKYFRTNPKADEHECHPADRRGDCEDHGTTSLFDEFQEQIDRVPEADIPTEVSSKFFDDVSGTEFEGRPRN